MKHRPYLRNSFFWDMPLHRWVLRTLEPLKMKAVLSFETSGTDYPVAQSHISEKRIPQPNRCEKMRIRKSMPTRVCASKPQQETYASF